MRSTLKFALFIFMVGFLMGPDTRRAELDHVGAYNFMVEIEGINALAFSDVSGLGTEIQAVDGDATFQLTRNLLTPSPVFDAWWDSIKGGKLDDARTVTITLELDGYPIAQWDALAAKPIGRRIELRKVNGGYAPIEHVRFKAIEVLRTLKPALPPAPGPEKPLKPVKPAPGK